MLVSQIGPALLPQRVDRRLTHSVKQTIFVATTHVFTLQRWKLDILERSANFVDEYRGNRNHFADRMVSVVPLDHLNAASIVAGVKMSQCPPSYSVSESALTEELGDFCDVSKAGDNVPVNSRS